jgi:hypothetical protein
MLQNFNKVLKTAQKERIPSEYNGYKVVFRESGGAFKPQ